MTPEWAEAFVDDVLEWSFMGFDDLEEVAELRAAIEYFDDPVQTISYADFVAAWNRPGAHASHHAVVGRERSGSIVAYGCNHPGLPTDANPSVWFDIGVHPAWRHQGIRHRLTMWLIGRAQQWWEHIRTAQTGALWVGTTVDEKRGGLTRSMIEAGLTPQRWFFDMHRPLEAGDSLPPLPKLTDVSIVPFDDSLSELVRQAHNEAMATRPGSSPVSAQAWESSINNHPENSQLSWVALVNRDTPAHEGAAHGRVVGYAMNLAYDDETSEGWTERLGVCPWCRKKGIGRALVIASMRGFADAGLTSAGVGVDTEDPNTAARFFGVLGFEETERVVVYGRTFRVEQPD